MKEKDSFSIVDSILNWKHIAGQPSGNGFSEGTDLYMSLITEEYKETLEAYNNKDFNEVTDGIGDTIWVLVGLADELGLDVNKIMKAIYDSNMTKFCKTEEEARITVLWYADETNPKCCEAYYERVKDVYVVRRKSDNKILKSINFQPVKFD